MSIPLDRLYNFLDGASNHDLIIYHWTPHGSRNLEDLDMLKEYPDLVKVMTLPMVIFHDQEPLNYYYYNLDRLLAAYKYYQPTSDLKLDFDRDNQKLMDNIKEMHIRGVGSAFANIYDQTIIVHSEQNSIEVEIYRKNGYVPVYYWSHALISRDWYRYAEYDPKLKTKNIQQEFLIYSRAWTGTREYRLPFAELLTKTGLWEECRMYFSEYDNSTHYTKHNFENPSFGAEVDNLSSFFNCSTAQSTASADYCAQDYQETRIEVVLETLFDDNRHHLTEKSLRPIACGHPFILAATPGSLEYLRSYGFQTFSSCWDESYDQIQDPIERMSAIINLMQNIVNLPEDQRQTLDAKMSEICKFNRTRFFSKDFFDQVIKEYQDNIAVAVNHMQSHRTGKYFRWWRKYMRELGRKPWPEFIDRDLAVILWRTLRAKV